MNELLRLAKTTPWKPQFSLLSLFAKSAKAYVCKPQFSCSVLLRLLLKLSPPIPPYRASAPFGGSRRPISRSLIPCRAIL